MKEFYVDAVFCGIIICYFLFCIILLCMKNHHNKQIQDECYKIRKEPWYLIIGLGGYIGLVYMIINN